MDGIDLLWVTKQDRKSDIQKRKQILWRSVNSDAARRDYQSVSSRIEIKKRD